MKIYENVLNPILLETVRSHIEHIDFPWYFSGTAFQYDEKKPHAIYDFSFSHMVYANGRDFNSSVKDLLEATVRSALEVTKQRVKVIHRIRLGMLTANKDKFVNQPHTDQPYPHMTGLIYLTTCNGPTILYNEKYDVNSKYGVDTYVQNELGGKLTVMAESPSVENNMVCFDGLHYHSSTMPSDVPRRIAINFNYDIC